MEVKVRLQIGQLFGFASWDSDSLMVGVRMPDGVVPVLMQRDSVDVGVKTVAGVKAVSGVKITPPSSESLSSSTCSFSVGGLPPEWVPLSPDKVLAGVGLSWMVIAPAVSWLLTSSSIVTRLNFETHAPLSRC